MITGGNRALRTAHAVASTAYRAPRTPLSTNRQLSPEPMRNSAPAISMPQCNPGMKCPRPPMSEPSSAIPITPPTWRLALSTAEPMPARSLGVWSIAACVMAGMASEAPTPIASMGPTALRSGAWASRNASPTSPEPPIPSPTTIGRRAPRRAVI